MWDSSGFNQSFLKICLRISRCSRLKPVLSKAEGPRLRKLETSAASSMLIQSPVNMLIKHCVLSQPGVQCTDYRI